MCRWIAYHGTPIFINQLVVEPGHSLLQQSLNAKLSYLPDGSIWRTNGDGFGLGWYRDHSDNPGLFRDSTPAWSDRNLHEISAQIKSGLFMAHIRAATIGQVQRTNSHPFKYKNWLFQHNGGIENFHAIKRDLLMLIDPHLFPLIQGSTDSEICFYLALTFGLEKDPKSALQKMIRTIDEVCKSNKVKAVYNFSCALTEGQKLYTMLSAKNEPPRTQFYSRSSDCIKDLTGNSTTLLPNSVVVVSEPLDELERNWQKVDNYSFMVFDKGDIQKYSLSD